MKRLSGVAMIKSAAAILALISIAGCHVSGAPAAQTIPIRPPVATGGQPVAGTIYVQQVVVSTPTTPSPGTIDPGR